MVFGALALTGGGVPDAFATTDWGGGSSSSHSAVDRGSDPVLVSATDIPDLTGYPIPDIGIFRYNATTEQFEPIPFQIDERLIKTFNEGGGDEFTQLIHDIFGEEDGTLDDHDEIALLFEDGGPQAPMDATWPAGADPLRFEISATDSRPGSPQGTKWIYLYTGPGLPTSGESHVSWTVSPSTSIVTEKFALDFTDKWLLTGYRLFSPCGTGVDILDRVKGRVDTGETIQSEEVWNAASTFLGGITGPIRAIRYVQGAASGVNTIHHDVVYRECWERQINLRVHPVNWVRVYLDWLPLPGASFFSPYAPDGVPVDGVPDSIGSSLPHWNLIRSSEGGMAVVYDIPASPLWSEKSQYYRDDLNHDDALLPGYPDDDDSAYGNHGFVVTDLLNSHLDAIPMKMNVHPLCSDVGDAEEGASYEDRYDYPIDYLAVPQTVDQVEIRSLTLRPDGGDVVLEWQPVATGAVYEIYRSDFPDVPRESWPYLGQTSDTTYRDPGAMSGPHHYYDVRPSSGS